MQYHNSIVLKLISQTFTDPIYIVHGDSIHNKQNRNLTNKNAGGLSIFFYY